MYERSASPTSLRAVRFAAVGALGVALQLAVLHLLATVLGVSYILATAVAVVSAVIHNFAWHRRWTWRDRPDHRVSKAFVRFALANGAVSLAGNIMAMTLLVGVINLPVVAANAVAIAVCSVLNYYLADRLVFQPIEPVEPLNF
jgi:putative flippase GtrA